MTSRDDTLVVDLLRRGRSAQWVSDAAGVSLLRVEHIAGQLGDALKPCADPARCGLPQSGAGRPRRGWLKVHVAGDERSTWHCSWRCVEAFARQTLVGLAVRE